MRRTQSLNAKLAFTCRRYSSLNSLVEIGPLSEYRRRIESGLLKPNEEQAITIVKLQKLCELLINYEPPTTPVKESPYKSFLTSPAFMKPNLISKNLMRQFNEDEEVYPGPKGLWIHGQVGNGKTLMMDMFFNSIPIEKKKRIHFHQFSVAVYSRIHQWQMSMNLDRRNHVSKIIAKDLMDEAWLICFDEFQLTDVATASVLKATLDQMFRMGAVLVTTSNRIPEDFVTGNYQRHIYAPFIDMLKDRCEVHHIRNTSDYRTLIHMDNPLSLSKTAYFRSDIPVEAEAFVQKVKALFYGKQEKQKILEIYGRKIIIKRHTSTTALFTFDDLCGSMTDNVMGPPDFLRICQEFPCIIVQNVPIMDLLQKNEARRFITFIDAAYENKVKLILSAEASPEQLFITKDGIYESSDAVMHREMIGELLDEGRKGKQGTGNEMVRLALFTAEDEKFAFKRAVSRLNEMMSETWWDASHAAQSIGDQIRTTPYVSEKKPQNANTSVNEKVNFDFAEEASYYGNLDMYSKYGQADLLERKIEQRQPEVKRQESMFDKVESMLRTKASNRPKFNETHFWGQGNRSKWGKELTKFFEDLKKK